jgi:hypothetical protein
MSYTESYLEPQYGLIEDRRKDGLGQALLHVGSKSSVEFYRDERVEQNRSYPLSIKVRRVVYYPWMDVSDE